MSKLIYDNLIISVREFMVLAALCGMTRIDFPMKKKQEAPDQKEVNLIFFQLYQKQLLRMKEQNTYELDSEIQRIFTEIKDSEYEIQAYSLERQSPLLFFVGEEIITIELSENDREALKLHCVSRKRFTEELCSQKLLPLENSGKGEGILEEEIKALHKQIQTDSWQFIRNHQVDCRTLMKYSKENRVRSFFIIKDRQSDREKGLLLILDCGIGDCMAYLEADSLKTGYYTEAEAKEALLIGML